LFKIFLRVGRTLLVHVRNTQRIETIGVRGPSGLMNQISVQPQTSPARMARWKAAKSHRNKSKVRKRKSRILHAVELSP